MESTNFYDGDYEKIVDQYSMENIEDIRKILPKWEIGEKYGNAYLEDRTYDVFNVNLEDLLKNIDLMDFDLETLFAGDLESDARVASTLERWRNNKVVSPPDIRISISDPKKMTIADGRHRVKLAYHLKLENIPIAINKTQVSTIRKILKLEDIY